MSCQGKSAPILPFVGYAVAPMRQCWSRVAFWGVVATGHSGGHVFLLGPIRSIQGTKMDDIQGRGKALENKFFGERDQELLNKLRAELDGKESRDALRAVSGIDNDEVLDQLISVGVSPESLSAISLIPLVSVAWCDQSMEKTEKEAILNAATSAGIEKDSASSELLGSWLSTRPGNDLLDAWKAYVGVLRESLDKAAFGQLKNSVVNRAEVVAEAAGGFFGVGSVSDKEKKAIADLAATFG